MRIEYDFLRVGSFVEPRRGHIYIDIGNQSVPGVIDTHPDIADKDHFSCSSSLVVAQPSLVTEWISEDDLRESVRLVMHEHPDYDCIASSYLVRRLLEARAYGDAMPGGWQEWAPLVAESARRIDRGETRVQLPIKAERTPLTPYLSMIALHDQVVRDARTPRDSWTAMIERGQEILDRAVRLARERGTSDLNVVDLRGALGDFGDLEAIIDRKIDAFLRDASRIGLHSLPIGGGELDAVHDVRLPVRSQSAGVMSSRMACILDPESGGGFFKTVIRGAYSDSIQATCIFETVAADAAAGTPKWIRPIISVDPDSPFDLRGLGRYLDELETKLRATLGMPRAGRPRPGFDNSDPWYDGRGFAYTIVDAPRWGTVLAADAVLNAIRDSDRWISIRIGEVAGESIEQLRSSSDASQRRKAFTAIVQAVDEWNSSPVPARPPLYRECVDAIVNFADEEDVAAHERLVAQLPDVLLGLLRNERATVRARALALAARARDFEKYAKNCDREDVLPLLQIASGSDPQRAIRLLSQEGSGSGDELLLDAVAAQIRTGAAVAAAVFSAAVALGERVVNLPRAQESIFILWTAARDAGLLDQAYRLDLCVKRIEIARAAPKVSLEAVRHLVAERQTADAARLLSAVLSGAASLLPERKRPVLDIARTLLEQCADGGMTEATTAIHVDCALARILAVFSVEDLLSLWGRRTATVACRLSPSFIGALIRGAEGVTARWTLLAAALDGGWSEPLADACRSVLTLDDARVYRHIESLTRVAAEPDGAPAPACGAQRMAFLLLAAARSRNVVLEPRIDDALAAVAALEDVSAGALSLGQLRRIVVDELRHAAPDHFLIADAESCLRKAETFAWMVGLAGEQDSVSGKAVVLLLRVAANLPEIRWNDVEELLRLKRTYRQPSSGELDRLGERVLACAEKLAQIRHEGVFTADGSRIKAVAEFLEAQIVGCLDTPIGQAVAIALHDVQAVIEAYGGLLEEAKLEHERDVDGLALRMLEASTLVRFAGDWRTFADRKTADVTLRLSASLARVSGAKERRRSHSEIRGKLGRAGSVEAAYKRAETTLTRLATDRSAAGNTLHGKYERIRALLVLPAEALDAAYAGLVDTLCSRYDMHTARHCIDDYSFGRLPALLRFWMSGWTVLIPAVFIGLFMIDVAWKGALVDVAMFALTAMTLMVAAVEWVHKRRTAGKPRTVESLRYRLFLPQYVVPVFIGVYTAAIGHEVASHLALQLDDQRYGIVAGAFFATATWALGQLIRRHGGKASARNVIVTAARLFSYGFIIALALNAMLAPLLHYEERLHHKRLEWIGPQEDATATRVDEAAKAPVAHSAREPLIPMEIQSAIFKHEILFPRHIILDAVFGMFVAIVLREFLKAGEHE